MTSHTSQSSGGIYSAHSPNPLPPSQTAPSSPNDHFRLPRSQSYDFLPGGGGIIRPRERGGRGMTFEEVQKGGILSAEERSHDFATLGIDLDEKAIGKLPKKLRPYYNHLASLAEHYEEVDALLSGSLPYTVATSFHPSSANANANASVGNAASASQQYTYHSDPDEEDTEGWLRRNSTWKVRKVRRESAKSASSGGRRAGSADRSGSAPGHAGGTSTPRRDERDRERGRGRETDVEDVGETTGLLSKGKEREARKERIAKIALNVNTIVNILLVAAKVVAVLYSSSISLTASLVDSALDLLSTFIILGTSWAMGIQTDRHKYPAGKRRFEPLGVLIFSVVMIASFVQVFIEAFNRAIKPGSEAPLDLSIIGAGTMVATIGIKTVLWIWCSQIPSSGVQALAQDAENDVMLNIISLSFPSVGTFLGWRLLDPIGGMVLSTYIVVEWIKTLLENFENLSGKSASPDQVTRVLYLVTRFNPVLEIGDVECYHIGDDLIVEVDVILPRGSTLHFAHDVGETIQCCLESLEGVLRAYVHTDYSSANPAQHTSRTPTAPAGPSIANGYGSSGKRPTIEPLPPIDAEIPPDSKAQQVQQSRGRSGREGRSGTLDGITEGVAR